MARHVSVELVDDIDGSPAAETVDFGLDGVRYTIDLSKDHAAQLRSTLRPYVRKARELRSPAGTGARNRRKAAANATALIRDLAERAKDQHRTATAPEPAPEHEAATEWPDQPDTAAVEPAEAPAVSETIAAAEPTAEPTPKPATALPLAPIFQPPQH